MTTPTVAVTCTANDQNGNPVAGAVLTAKLNQTEIYNGLIVPEIVTGTADATGVVVLNLWPNELGVNGSMYQVRAVNPTNNKRFLDATVSVPNSNCNLHEIITTIPYPPIDASQQALAAAQSIYASVSDQTAIATAAASAASGSAGNASSSSAAAAISESNAATSVLNASYSETNAYNYSVTAGIQAASATGSATTASTNATNATASALSATNSATAAAASAVTASTESGNAAASAATASSQASAALTSANNAATSKTGADNARDAALAAQAASELALDSFDDRYLGAKAVAPTLDNDGNALLTGALYFDTVIGSGTWRAWNGSAWVTAPAANASAVVNTPAGNIAATNVQNAINELDTEKEDAAKIGRAHV